MATRSTTKIFLIGHPASDINTSGLPTKLQFLRKYFHHQKVEKYGRIKSLNLCFDRIVEFWNRARIPTMRRDSAIRKMESVLKVYDNLVKSKALKYESQRKKEQMFWADLNQIMDIAHSNAKEMMTNTEDITFLEMQRDNPQSCSMSAADLKLHHSETRKRKRLEEEDARRNKSEITFDSMKATAVLESSSGSDTEEIDNDPEVDFSSNSKDSEESDQRGGKKRSVNVITQEVAATYDRLNISYRNAAASFTVTAKALGHNIDDVSVSASTMYRKRNQHRKSIAEAYQSEEFCPGNPLILHWDGKMLPDIIQSNKTVDRIAILVSSGDKEKLLGVPKVEAGTGEKMARACVEQVKENEMVERIQGLSFDTTASNTGPKAGTCVLIEQKLKRDLLHFACRHHVYEIVLSDVFKTACGPTQGPEISIFKRFKGAWGSIDHSDIEPFEVSDDETMLNLKHKTVELVRQKIKETQQRDDYKELLELVLLFLGEASTNEFRLKAPGGLHNARWMAKAIYAIKIILFKKQFELTKREEEGLTAVGLFVSLVYIRAWCRAAIPHEAARTDLEFICDAEAFFRCGSPTGKAARDAMYRHLWYLSETLVGMSFFDENIALEEKRKMVESLKKPPSKKALKRLEGKKVGNMEAKTISDFVSSKTKVFFESFNLDTDFLQVPAEDWDSVAGYKSGMEVVAKIAVTNDRAERGIALIKDFNNSLTKNEEQKQYLLKTVVDNRATFPKKTKSEFKNC